MSATTLPATNDECPAGWGVYLESCAVCGKGLVLVAPADRPPVFPLCRAHDPVPEETGEAA